ncbi:MAG TPA: helix-turn-helix domain-containing protein [Planctomycetota bacterium]|nr:helix-turn-helix domain-containing protein [Planctomycetota bacterium]
MADSKRATSGDTLLNLIDAISTWPTDTFSTPDIAMVSGVPYSSVYTYLQILERRGWVEGHLDHTVYKKRGVYEWRRLIRVQVADATPTKVVKKRRKRS